MNTNKPKFAGCANCGHIWTDRGEEVCPRCHSDEVYDEVQNHYEYEDPGGEQFDPR